MGFVSRFVWLQKNMAPKSPRKDPLGLTSWERFHLVLRQWYPDQHNVSLLVEAVVQLEEDSGSGGADLFAAVVLQREDPTIVRTEVMLEKADGRMVVQGTSAGRAELETLFTVYV